MAMYPNPPSWRIPYDVDGTQGHLWHGSAVWARELTQTELQNMQKELPAYHFVGGDGPYYYSFLFPEPRDIDAMAIIYQGTGTFQIAPTQPEWSNNTTNGWDGTWTSTGKSWTHGTSKPYHRNNIQSLGALGVTALRWGGNQSRDAGYLSVQLYGERSAGATGKFLYVWHPTLDQRIGYTTLDYGDVPRTSSGDVQIRIKNESTLTANNVIVTTQTLMDGTPSVGGQFAVSLDGSTFTAQVNIGNLSAGAISSLVTVRRSFASNAALGIWWPRIKADPGSWT